MYTILVTESNELVTSVKERIMQRSKLVDSLHFLMDTLTAYPTHIVISCAASQFGDYFTGYDGSQLWLDHFEFIYE